MTDDDEQYLVTDGDLLAEVDLASPDEMLGTRRGLVIRDSGVRCGKPVVYPVGPRDLPSTLRRRAKTSASHYYGLLLAFDLLPPAKAALSRLSTGGSGRIPKLARGVALT